jgi:TRAP-type C4-dicarboxylate transport system permease small subunit
VFVWLAFIGTSVALQRGAHISINLVVDHLGPAAQRTISIIVRILILGFAIIMIWYGARLCLSTQMVSTVLEIPMSIPYAAIPFSGSLMAFHGIVGITRLIARGESETAQ